MIYGSVCSGIEAASVAWEPIGWKPSFFSEIDKFPRRVLSHHYPDVPCHGDFTTIKGNEYEPIDLLVGGTPCQSFSVAGLRGGMADSRGNLALEFLRLLERTGARWFVWENVPGVLSSNGGRDFGAFLGGVVELGYGFAYRVLNAQYFGVAQRRRRVFVVGYLGDWRRAAAVLFERESLCGHSAPRRNTGTPVAALTANGVGTCGTDDNQAQAGHLILTLAIRGRDGGHQLEYRDDGIANAILTPSGGRAGIGVGAIMERSNVRRLTPRECERLQGFPDDYTLIPWGKRMLADGPRYKALGNSMAVPCMRWIGERIRLVA